MSPLEILVAVAIAVGIAGVVLPVLPGLLVVWVAVLVWATEIQEPVGWAVLAIVTVILGLSQVVKYLLPGRQMKAAGLPNRSLVAGAVLGIAGFFVVPVVGLPLGFVLGIYLAERVRLGAHAHAWTSTIHALKGVGLSIVIEMGAGILAAIVWLAGALSTA